MKKIIYAEDRFRDEKKNPDRKGGNSKMKRKNMRKNMDLQTLLAYTVIAMAFSVGLIVLAAILTSSDVVSWNTTALVSVFFVMTGMICGFFILRR